MLTKEPKDDRGSYNLEPSWVCTAQQSSYVGPNLISISFAGAQEQ